LLNFTNLEESSRIPEGTASEPASGANLIDAIASRSKVWTGVAFFVYAG
jgi:hypothetical protein